MSLVRSNLEHATCVWSPHQAVHADRIERVQRNFVRFALRRLPWTVSRLPQYFERSLLLGLDALADRRTVASALFARDIICGRIDCACLSELFRFENIPYPRRRNTRIVPFFHRRNYGRYEPVNQAIINLNKYCSWFGFDRAESREVVGGRLRAALSSVRLGRRQMQYTAPSGILTVVF
jgi:hypothetical protein